MEVNKIRGKAMTTAKKYVKYYRVSTKRQGKSGLGLEAQRAMLSEYPTMAEFTEIESGANCDREQFQAAITLARKERAILLVARIDRLSRDFAFIIELERAGIDFEIANLPGANRLTIHIMAAMAEQERALICARQKDAWAQRKARAKSTGQKIDFSQFTNETRRLGAIARQNKAKKAKHNVQAYAHAKALREQGKSFHQIASALNQGGYRTTRNAQYYATTVSNLFKLYAS